MRITVTVVRRLFKSPLREDQLQRYLASVKQPLTLKIFVAETNSGGAVGHVELTMIWPHFLYRLSRGLVDIGRRCGCLGKDLVTLALKYAFREHAVAQVDLGDSKDDPGAIGFYEHLGFA